MEQLTSNDIRNLAVAIDGGGNEFLAYTEGPDYLAKIMRISPNGKRDIIHRIPGIKHSTIDLAVVGANLRVYTGIRMTDQTDDFPLYRYDLVGMCVPLGSKLGVLAPPAPAAPVEAIDSIARQTASAAQKAADAASKKAADVGKQLSSFAGGKLPEPVVQAVRDVLWNTPTLKDRIYTWLKERDAGLVGEIRAIVKPLIDQGRFG